MPKVAIPTFLLAAYSILLINLLVLKTVSFKIGHLMLDFSGYTSGPANFVPFKTILPYLFGYKGLIIILFNLVGNIVLFVPFGFLIPFVFPKISWKKTLMIAVAAPLSIEVVQQIFQVGIFDVDDIILNGLGVMIGYWVFLVYAKWVRSFLSKRSSPSLTA